MKDKIMKQLKRGAGILLPISSLPSEHGIGTLGKAAYEFVNTLTASGQRYWQVLPVGPTGFGNSPYQPFSVFAGSPYYIDLNTLAEEGLLNDEEINSVAWGENETEVNYELVYKNRFCLLKHAYENSQHKSKEEFLIFCNQSTYWLDDYCLFMALKGYFGNSAWYTWNEEIRLRLPSAIKKYKIMLQEEMNFWKFCQYKFWSQWKKLKIYANQKGIKIIGDMPLYAAMDSCDVWVHGKLFELDENKLPINVAGVPPDYFSKEGQRWGNPIYNWEQMERTEYAWWKERINTNVLLYDVIRLGHFIGIVRFYSIPSDCKTAVKGKWRRGPGSRLTDIINQSIGEAHIIAEDLGVVTPVVLKLLKKNNYPGMKILQFAFDGDSENTYLPHNYISDNTVVYIGTHDNDTLISFLKNCNKETEKYILSYFRTKIKKELPANIFAALYACNAKVVIIQAQDLLLLDSSARTNKPSSLEGNWKWRMTENQMNLLPSENLKLLTQLYGR